MARAIGGAAGSLASSVVLALEENTDGVTAIAVLPTQQRIWVCYRRIGIL